MRALPYSRSPFRRNRASLLRVRASFFGKNIAGTACAVFAVTFLIGGCYEFAVFNVYLSFFIMDIRLFCPFGASLGAGAVCLYGQLFVNSIPTQRTEIFV